MADHLPPIPGKARPTAKEALPEKLFHGTSGAAAVGISQGKLNKSSIGDVVWAETSIDKAVSGNTTFADTAVLRMKTASLALAGKQITHKGGTTFGIDRPVSPSRLEMLDRQSRKWKSLAKMSAPEILAASKPSALEQKQHDRVTADIEKAKAKRAKAVSTLPPIGK